MGHEFCAEVVAHDPVTGEPLELTAEDLQRGWDEHGFGRWAVERRSDGALPGAAPGRVGRDRRRGRSSRRGGSDHERPRRRVAGAGVRDRPGSAARDRILYRYPLAACRAQRDVESCRGYAFISDGFLHQKGYGRKGTALNNCHPVYRTRARDRIHRHPQGHDEGVDLPALAAVPDTLRARRCGNGNHWQQRDQ